MKNVWCSVGYHSLTKQSYSVLVVYFHKLYPTIYAEFRWVLSVNTIWLVMHNPYLRHLGENSRWESPCTYLYQPRSRISAAFSFQPVYTLLALLYIQRLQLPIQNVNANARCARSGCSFRQNCYLSPDFFQRRTKITKINLNLAVLQVLSSLMLAPIIISQLWSLLVNSQAKQWMRVLGAVWLWSLETISKCTFLTVMCTVDWITALTCDTSQYYMYTVLLLSNPMNAHNKSWSGTWDVL